MVRPARAPATTSRPNCSSCAPVSTDTGRDGRRALRAGLIRTCIRLYPAL